MADFKINPVGIPDFTPGSDFRTITGHLVENAAEIPAIPTRLYGIASKALSALTDYVSSGDGDSAINHVMRIGSTVIPGLGAIPLAADAAKATGLDEGLPGVDTANEITKTISDKAHELGSDFAGRPLRTGLIGDQPVADKVGTALAIANSLVPVTGGPIKAGLEGLKNIDTGVKAVDRTVQATAEAIKFLSPIVPVDTTAGAAIVAGGGAALGTGATVVADVVGRPDAPPITQPDPQYDQVIDQFKQMYGGNAEQLNQESKASTDLSTDGVGQSLDAKLQLDHHDAIEQFKSVNWADPADVAAKSQKVINAGTPNLEDHKTALTALGAVIIGAAAAWMKKDVVNAKVLEWLGGKDFSKVAREDFVSKPNATNLRAGDVAAAQTVDASIPLVREAANPEEMRGRFEKVGSAWNSKSTSMHADGTIDPYSNVKLQRPLGEFVNDVKVLAADPAKLQLLRDGANSISEMGNRVRAWLEDTKPVGVGVRKVNDPLVIGEYTNWLAQSKQAVPPGTATTAAQLQAIEGRYAFHSLDPANNTVKSFSDLLADRRAAMADPVVGKLLNEFADITKKVGLDYRLEKGLITKKEYKDLSDLHPQYYPVRIKGAHMSQLELSKAGGRLEQGDPLKELFPYLEETVKDVAHEELKRSFMMEQLAMKRQGKQGALDLIGREDIREVNKHNADKVVQFRDYQGKQRIVEVRDPMVRYSLQKGAGTAALRMTDGTLGILGFPSRVLESLTTGPTAAVVGSVFAPVNMAYGSLQVLVNRPVGTTAGILDSIMQGLTKGKVGFRGDPTFHAQVLNQAVANIGAVLAKNAGNALAHTVSDMSWVKPAIGNKSLEAWSNTLSNYYKTTTLHALERAGIHGGATPMARRTTPTLADLEGALTPAAKTSQGWQVTRDFVHDLLGAVGNSPQAAFYKQNKGKMSEGLLNTRTRNVQGDPAKSGLGTNALGKMAIGGAILSPWGHVTVQSMSRFIHSIRTNPAGTAMAITNGVAIPTMIAMNWNAVLGKDYVDYATRVRTPDQVAGAIYVGIPGRPPEEGLEIPVDQPMRPFKVLAETLYGSHIGLLDGSFYDPKNEAIQNMIKDSMSTRYGLTGDAISSAWEQILPAIPTFFAPFTVGVLGTNQTFRGYLSNPTTIKDNKMAGASDSTSKNIDNKWFGYDVSSRSEALLNEVGGMVGRAVYDTLTAIGQGKKDGLTSSEMRSDFADRWMMNLDQSTRMVSGVWGHAGTISPSQEAAAKAVQLERQGIMKLDAAYTKLAALHGSGESLVGAKGREIDALVGSGPVEFKDQQMMSLAFASHKFAQVYARQYAGPMKDLYEQRASALSSEKVSPDAKRELVNNISKQIVNKNREALSAVQQWQMGLNKMFGRSIDFKNIHLDEPITQFPEMQ